MHRAVPLLVPILFLTACGGGTVPPGIVYTITSGKNEVYFLEQLTLQADLTLSDGTLSLKRKEGLNNWLLKNRLFEVKDGGSFTTVDHHVGVSFRVRLLANGDVLLSYQAHHHPPGMQSPELDTGSIVIPKAFVHAP